MATHSSILAWRIPWTEEPGRLQSMGSPRVGHDLVTKLPLQQKTQFPEEDKPSHPLALNKFKFDGFQDVVVTIQIPNPRSQLPIHAYSLTSFFL